MMRNKLTMLALALLLTPLAAFGQTGVVAGVVTDGETGEPIPGVNVAIVELQVGAATNVDGEFVISDVPARAGYTVRATFVGYRQYETSIDVAEGERVDLAIALEAGDIELDELVVTAQQIERQAKSLGYAVSSVSGENIEQGRETNLVNSLSGKVAGVEVTSQSGNIGGSSRILIRGVSSLDGENQPLFVVDGVPISNSNISSGSRITGTIDTGNRAMDINPADIASVTVLKGAAAAALYGQRAKNGVVLIQTKRGQARPKSSISVTTSLNASNPFRLPDFQNEYGPGDFGKYDEADLDGWGPRIDGQMVPNFAGDTLALQAFPDNVADFYDTGLTYSTNIAFSNANEFSDFRLSVSRLDQGGIIPSSDRERTTINFNAGTEFANRWNARIGANYVKDNTVGRVAAGANDPNVLTSIINLLPRTISNEMMEEYIDPETGEQVALDNFTNNPYWIINENLFTTELDRVFGFAEIGYDPLEWLSFTARGGTDFYTEDRQRLNRPGTVGRDPGNFRDDTIQEVQLNFDFLATAEQDLTSSVNLQGIAGLNVNETRFDRKINEANELTVDELYSYSNARLNSPVNDFSQRRLIGVFGDLTFGYNDYLFLNLTGRNDWSSTLPDDNNSYFYPSANLSVIFTEALDLQSDVLSYGKLRLNYAEVGSDTDPYQLLFRYFPTPDIFGQYNTSIVFPFGGFTGFEATDVIPPFDLKPQRQRSYELGTELRFFNGRLGLDFTYYNQVTSDQILNLPIPESTGFALRRTNVGEVSNEGFEINALVSPITTRMFSWNMNINFQSNENTVTELFEGVDEIVLQSAFNGLQVKAVPGEPLGLYGTGFRRCGSAPDVPAEDRVSCATADGEDFTQAILIDPETGLRQAGGNVRLGDLDSDFRIGMNNSFSFGNFSLDFLIDWKRGGVIFSNTVASLRRTGLAEETAANRDGTFIDTGVIITGEDDQGNVIVRENDVPVQDMEDFWNTYNAANIAEGNVFDASYVKLREAVLSYTLPSSWMRGTPFGRATISVEGRNLLLLYSKVPHIDPETNLFGSGAIGEGVEWNNLPSVRSFGASVNFTF